MSGKRLGMVFMRCPKCDGNGGMINIDGTQQICSVCHNQGCIREALSDYTARIENDVIDKCIEIVRSSYFQMEAEQRIEQLKEQNNLPMPTK